MTTGKMAYDVSLTARFTAEEAAFLVKWARTVCVHENIGLVSLVSKLHLRSPDAFHIWTADELYCASNILDRAPVSEPLTASLRAAVRAGLCSVLKESERLNTPKATPEPLGAQAKVAH